MVDTINAATFVLRDVLVQLNIALNKIQGQCYYGASCMSGTKSDVAKRLLDSEARTLHTHCCGHAFYLAWNNSIKQNKLLKHVQVQLVKRVSL